MGQHTLCAQTPRGETAQPQTTALIFDNNVYVWTDEYLRTLDGALQRYAVDIESYHTEAHELPTYTPKLPVVLIQSYSLPLDDFLTRVYIGVGGGSAFAQAAFSSFGVGEMKWGYNAEVVVGVETSPFFSIELFGGYSLIRLGATESNQNLYYLDQNYHFAPVVGSNSVNYGDMLAKTELLSLGVRANMNLVGLWDKKSRWQILVSPRIGVAFSHSQLLGNGEPMAERHNTHFTAGIALGTGVMFSEHLGLRLLSGVEHLWGEQIDLVPICSDKANYTWNTTLSLIFKL